MSAARTILDVLVLRYLSRRGWQHLQSGFPAIAVFAFDHIGHEVNVRGRYEGVDLDLVLEFLVRSNVSSSSTVVDVGANIGNHSLFFAVHFSRVIALEPNPRVFELLSFNARLSKKIVVLNMGASDVTGERNLAFTPANWGGGRLVDCVQDPTNVSVRVTRLDDLPQLTSLSLGLIKIDVEGHELSVLKGAAKLLSRWRPALLFEQREEDIVEGSSPAVDWLRRLNYTDFFEVRSSPSLPRGWSFSGRRAINGALRVVAGERKKVVQIKRFAKAFYPMIIALPASSEPSSSPRTGEVRRGG
jgi:FkbM family methyltransferase